MKRHELILARAFFQSSFCHYLSCKCMHTEVPVWSMWIDVFPQMQSFKNMSMEITYETLVSSNGFTAV